MTIRFAISVLEDEFNAIYRGIKTVDEMTKDCLVSAIQFEDKSSETVYHMFETKTGSNRIVEEMNLVPLANFYA
jgi:hypothetical protein